jgi:FlaA1/EpsC-like NDP-sugar epimerase
MNARMLAELMSTEVRPVVYDGGWYHGRKVMVTGAGGSIGSQLVAELCRMECPPSQLLLVDNDEYRLYEVDRRCTLPHVSLLCDVRHEAVVNRVFHLYRPDACFHAAALKHVPMLQVPHNMAEAVRTNVGGTERVLLACARWGCTEFLMISTDKAVRPSSIMGATKRAAEKVCFFLGVGMSTTVRVVRFGNVLGSSGSVLPLFTEQVRAGGPVTVTHQDMTRYMMTIRDAVGLVITAGAFGVAPGVPSLHVLNMGKPVRVDDLATAVIEMQGLRRGVDVEVRYSGLRPGEKLHEELFHEAENPVVEGREPGMWTARTPAWDPYRPGVMSRLMMRAEELNPELLMEELRATVPDYSGGFDA